MNVQSGIFGRSKCGWLLTGVALSALMTAVAAQAADQTQPTAAAQVAQAQPAVPETAQTETAGGLQEVVVTAQKRKENIQKVPISITAVTAVAIEQAHLANLEALAGAIPNMQIGNFANTPNTAVVTIRGMSVIDPDPYAGQVVAIVQDGVPDYFNEGSLLNLFDVDRVEVLRGPQGTLFGANTIGGVVNVVTAQPTDEFGGKVEATVGNYSRFDINGTLNVPIVKGLLDGKIDVFHNGQDGYVKNVVNGNSMGDIDTTAVRGYLKFTPNADFTATLIGEYDRGRNGAPVVVDGAVPGEALYVPPGTTFAGSGGQYVSPCVPAGSPCHAPSQYLSAINSVPDISNVDTYAGTFTVDWSSPIGQVTAITGYKNTVIREFTDQDGTVLFLDDTDRKTDLWQFSQEIRDRFHPTEDLDVLVGGFAMVDHYDLYQKYRIPGLAFPGFGQETLQDQQNWSGSLFTQADYHITDSLTLTAGLRGTYENTDMRVSINNYINTADQSIGGIFGGFPLAGSFTTEDSHSWDNLGAKINLSWQVTPDALTYAYYARGFKSGGYVGRITAPQFLGPYAPEYVDTFEVGAKTRWFDNRLQVNVAAFYNLYHDMQLAEIFFTKNSTGQTVNGNTILNAGQAVTRGFEAEVNARPTDDLRINGSVAYLDAHYTTFLFPELNSTNNTPFNQNLEGAALQDAPKWTAVVGFDYHMPFIPGDAHIGAQYRYTDSKYDTALNDTPRSFIQPTHYLDATLNWAPDDDAQWSIELWGRNLNNEHDIASVYDAPGVFGLVNYAPPREFGATFKYRFDAGEPTQAAPAPAPMPPPAPAPEPPAPPAPQPEAQRAFQVFFDFDKSVITDAAATVIEQAAASIKSGHDTRITVTGHTDTVGSVRYNQKLSERRADAVKAKLIVDGVSGGDIATRGVGKTDLLVPTPDGVREPQNRRAEIVAQ